MKRLFVLVIFAAVSAVSAVWCPVSFAARQAVAVDSPINAVGIAGGVDLTGNVTLSVGTVGGAQTNIFTDNDPVGTVFGLAVSTSASSQGNILFNTNSTVFGNIGVTQPGGPFLLNITGGADSATVNFLGSVFATTTFVSGTGRLNFNSGNTNQSATIFNGDGTISLATNTTLIGALTTAAGASSGTLILGGGSLLDGAVGASSAQLKAITVTGGSNTAGVTGTVSGAAFVRTLNLGTNTLNIGGALTIGAGGSVNTTIASPTVFGNVRPIGATNLPATLTLNVTVPDTAILVVGNQFNIIQTRAGTAQSGTDGSVVTATIIDPTNPLYSFSAVPLAGTSAGLVTIQVDSVPALVPITPPAGVVLPSFAPVAAAVVPALLATSPVVLAAINALSDPADVVNAEAQLAPSAPGVAAALVTFQGTRLFQHLWLSRLDDLQCGQVADQADKDGDKKKTSNCSEYAPTDGWWLKGFGITSEQDSEGSFVGYDANTFGAMIAYDTVLGKISNTTRAGLGLGYARSEIDGKVFDAETDINTYRATAYIGYEPGPWFLRGDMSFGWNEYTSTRNIVFPGVNRRATAEYDGQDYTAFVTGGHHFYSQGFTVTPLASLQYSHLYINGYTESGAGNINLKVSSKNYDFLESGLGVKVARPFFHNAQKIIPEVHFNWFHELTNPTLKQTARFNVADSPSFTPPGFKTSDNTYNVGGGVTFLSCECNAGSRWKWAVQGVYDYEWRNDGYDAHQGMVRVSSRF